MVGHAHLGLLRRADWLRHRGHLVWGDLDPTDVEVGGTPVSVYGQDGSNVTTPAVVVQPDDPWWASVLTSGPTESARIWRWVVLCAVAQQDPASSFDNLSGVVEAVNTALRADATLGGVVPYQSVVEITAPYQENISGAEVLSALVRLNVTS